MPDLLLELFSEEIPARMQRRGAEDLRRLMTDGLVEAGLTYDGAKAFATPRRLALTVQGLTARSPDIREERKGPRVGAPAQALEGFLRAAGLSSIDEAQVQSDGKKGAFYVVAVTKPGRPAEEIIAELTPEVIKNFPWPKTMRWGARSAPDDSPFSGRQGEGAVSLRWVRPLRSILCTFGPETEEPVVVPVEVAGIVAGNLTYGHRFMAGEQPIRVRRFDDYGPALASAKVVLDTDRRIAIIETEARNLAFAQGLELVDDPGLLEEVAGLVEWPVVLMGRFDPAFLDIPDEVIRLTIRQNQKCFVLRHSATTVSELSSRFGRAAEIGTHEYGGSRPARSSVPGSRAGASASSGMTTGQEVRLTDRFILVSNIEASDGGAAIVAGNERVIAARLADARFFWEQDKATPLEDWAKKLDGVTFHEKLGSQAERVERMARLARELAPLVGADPDDAERAARLAKADLVTGMVGEFPELQGVMGRYYALAQNGLLPSSPSSELSSRFGREAETGTHEHGRAERGGFGVHGSRTGADAPSGMTTGEGGRGEDRIRAIADAIRDHYKPQGPSDSVPTEPVSVAVALADKLDTLVGFWAIDEKPTGSKDPYALRRAALGVIRIVLHKKLRIKLVREVEAGFRCLIDQRYWSKRLYDLDPGGSLAAFGFAEQGGIDLDYFVDGNLYSVVGDNLDEDGEPREWLTIDTTLRAFKYASERELLPDLLAFFADRLKVHLRETGARHDLIDAVFALPGQDDLLMIVRRVEALGRFLDTENGANLLVGYRRAANILRAEEKKDGEGAFSDPPEPNLIEARGLPEERALFHVLQRAEKHAREHVAAENFEGAMQSLAELRPAVDVFFDKVTVNAEDSALRANRLKLLNMLRQATLAVADFSRIGG